MRNERSHERKDQAGSCDPDPSTCMPGTNERTNGAPFALFCPSSVRVRAVHLLSSCTPFSTITLAIFPTAPASRGRDVIHACDATRIVLPHRHTGVELCRIRSRPRIHLSAITCPFEEGEEGEEEEEADSGPIRSWGLGSSIGDLANTAPVYTPCFTAPARLLITADVFFACAKAVADGNAGESAEFGPA